MQPRRIKLLPRVEGLEGRAVLAAPPGLIASLTAAPDAPGVIKLVLTETNTTDHTLPVSEGAGYAVVDFWLTQGDTELWRLRRDEPMLLSAVREGVPFQAGESRSFTFYWRGQLRSGATLDTTQLLTFHGEVDDALAEATSPPPTPAIGGGNGATAGIETVGTNLAVSIRADRATYRQGRPVMLTITETNLGQQPVAVKAAGITSLTISRGGVTVWKYAPLRLVNASAATTLAPGQSRTFQVVWNGAFNSNPRQPRTGAFLATVGLDGRTSSVALAIARR
ncbi:MAG: hypothetical protein U0794_05700 [Isosphaeraceae bacterium]